MKKQDDTIKKLEFSLNEIKYQYNLIMTSFDDIKNKNQILLFICSLLLTLPLSNEFIMTKLIASKCFLLILFISGIICLTFALLLLIFSMFDSKLSIPEVEHISSAIEKFDLEKTMKAVQKRYIEDLNSNQKKVESKRKLIRPAERFIIAGVILIVLPILILIIKEGGNFV